MENKMKIQIMLNDGHHSVYNHECDKARAKNGVLTLLQDGNPVGQYASGTWVSWRRIIDAQETPESSIDVARRLF